MISCYVIIDIEMLPRKTVTTERQLICPQTALDMWNWYVHIIMLILCPSCTHNLSQTGFRSTVLRIIVFFCILKWGISNINEKASAWLWSKEEENVERHHGRCVPCLPMVCSLLSSPLLRRFLISPSRDFRTVTNHFLDKERK